MDSASYIIIIVLLLFLLSLLFPHSFSFVVFWLSACARFFFLSFVWSMIILPIPSCIYFKSCKEKKKSSEQSSLFIPFFFPLSFTVSSQVTIPRTTTTKMVFVVKINLIQIHLFTTYYSVNVTDASFGFVAFFGFFFVVFKFQCRFSFSIFPSNVTLDRMMLQWCVGRNKRQYVCIRYGGKDEVWRKRKLIRLENNLSMW